MTLKERNAMQIAEALGDVNRYYFYQHYGVNGSDEELVMYYIEYGARDFSLRNEDPQSRSMPRKFDVPVTLPSRA